MVYGEILKRVQSNRATPSACNRGGGGWVGGECAAYDRNAVRTYLLRDPFRAHLIVFAGHEGPHQEHRPLLVERVQMQGGHASAAHTHKTEETVQSGNITLAMSYKEKQETLRRDKIVRSSCAKQKKLQNSKKCVGRRRAPKRQVRENAC